MSHPAEPRIRLTVAEARALAESVVRGIGYDAEESAIVAEHVIDAALCGYEYSGLPKLLDAVEDKRSAMVRTPMRILKETPVSVLFDGGGNIGMLTIQRLAQAVRNKAVTTGFAVGGVMNSWMSGRGAHYVESLVRADLVAIHTVGASRHVAPLGGIRPMLGTNPLTIGLPSDSGPLIFDMGTSAIMYTDMTLRQRRGQELPEGVAIDAQGLPTRDPAQARAGALLPFAGHKGFGLGLMMQAMGLLAGAGRSPAKDYGFLIIAFQPDLLVPADEYKAELAGLIQRVKDIPRAPGVDEIRIPSERSFRERERNLAQGIEIDATIHTKLLGYAR